MADPQVRLEKMLATMKQHNFRLTPQRLAVLKILAVSADHPSVERIYEQVKADFPTTSLATIYKTITLLKELHEVLEVHSSESNRYDGNNPAPHPHVICIKCKKVMDSHLAGLEQLAAEAAQETGYKIVEHRLDFFGICPQCQAQG
jgi:Fur family peroxide stress response transcriptional regulator